MTDVEIASRYMTPWDKTPEIVVEKGPSAIEWAIDDLMKNKGMTREQAKDELRKRRDRLLSGK